VRSSNGDPQELVYAAPGYNRTQEIAERLLTTFIKKDATVLDVGCGFGRFYPIVKAMGGSYQGIDFSEEMIKEASKRNPDGVFIEADFEFYTGRFDVVFECICLSSTQMQYEQFRKHLLRQFVKPGGVLIMVEPEQCSITVQFGGNLFDS